MIVVTISSALCGWIVSERRAVKDRAVYRDVVLADKGNSINEVFLSPPEPPAKISLVRHLLGDTPLLPVIYLPEIDLDGKEPARVRALFPEAQIYLSPYSKVPPPPGILELEHRKVAAHWCF